MQKHTVSVITKLYADETETFRFMLSKASPDRAGDTVDPAGWKLDAYLKNPVVLWGHDQHTPAIGRASNLRVTRGELVGDVEFATGLGHELADTVAALVKGRFLNAVSVGFIPLRWELNADNGVDFKEQELFEFSVVNVPALPEALRKAHAAGIDLSPISKSIEAAPWANAALRKALSEQSAGPALPNLGRHRAAVSGANINLARIIE